MKKTSERQPSARVRIFFAVLAVLILTAGCASLKGADPQTETSAEAPDETGPLPSEFGDILLPQELKPIPDQTFFLNTGGFSAGVIALKGRVDGSSLVAFFQGQMQRDNWQSVGFFKSVRSLMMFYKDNRWCVISITEKDFYTYVEVWVAPTLHPIDAGLLK